MEDKYSLEIWQYHVCVEKHTFTNLRACLKWLKESGWIIVSNNGDCWIALYKNNISINWWALL